MNISRGVTMVGEIDDDGNVLGPEVRVREGWIGLTTRVAGEDPRTTFWLPTGQGFITGVWQYAGLEQGTNIVCANGMQYDCMEHHLSVIAAITWSQEQLIYMQESQRMTAHMAAKLAATEYQVDFGDDSEIGEGPHGHG